MYVRLTAPKKVSEKANESISRVEDMNKSSAIELPKKKLEVLKKFIFDYYEDWDTSTQSEREKLVRYNKILDGNLPKTDFPFGTEHSSQIDLKLAAGQFRAFRTLFRRSIFDNPNLFVAKSDNLNRDRDKLVKMEKAIYWHAKEKTNLISVLKDSDLPCFRDGTALITGSWVRRIESGVDYKTYKNMDEFQIDYPTYKSAGITSEKYDEIIEFLAEPLSTDSLQVEYDIDFIKNDGIEFKLFPKANFIYYPFFVDNVEDLMIYGYLYKETAQNIKSKMKSGFYSEDAKDLLSKDGESVNDEFNDSWDASRDEIDGVSSENKDVVQIAKLNIKIDLNDDDIPEKYTVHWHQDKKIILRIEKYRIRKNIPDVVAFKFIARDGRLSGVSMLDGVSDLLLEVNAIHRHRSNVRRLTDAPVPMFPESMKQTMLSHKFMPGKPMWIPDQLWNIGKLPQQFSLQNVDTTRTSIDEENMILKYTETLLGPTQGLSGQVDPSDPSAPGNKTQMLLSQANARVQDYNEEWKRSIPAILNLLIALTFQNTEAKIGFIDTVNGEKQLEELDIEDFVGDDIKFALSANTVSLSPELDMGKIQAVASSAINMGVAQEFPNILVELFNQYVAASRVPGFEKILIPTGNEEEVGMKLNAEGGNAESTQQNVANGIPIMPGTQQRRN